MVTVHSGIPTRVDKEIIVPFPQTHLPENSSELIKVSSSSKPTAVAGAIAGILREESVVQVQAIGASAVNQAVKSIAIASSYLEEDHLSLACLPSFVEVDIRGQSRTAIRFSVWV